jgi:hypothetical protein
LPDYCRSAARNCFPWRQGVASSHSCELRRYEGRKFCFSSTCELLQVMDHSARVSHSEGLKTSRSGLPPLFNKRVTYRTPRVSELESLRYLLVLCAAVLLSNHPARTKFEGVKRSHILRRCFHATTSLLVRVSWQSSSAKVNARPRFFSGASSHPGAKNRRGSLTPVQRL